MAAHLDANYLHRKLLNPQRQVPIFLSCQSQSRSSLFPAKYYQQLLLSSAPPAILADVTAQPVQRLSNRINQYLRYHTETPVHLLAVNPRASADPFCGPPGEKRIQHPPYKLSHNPSTTQDSYFHLQRLRKTLFPSTCLSPSSELYSDSLQNLPSLHFYLGPSSRSAPHLT